MSTIPVTIDIDNKAGYNDAFVAFAAAPVFATIRTPFPVFTFMCSTPVV
jgi:hypothetical protein